MDKIRYKRNAHWLKPYVSSVAHLVPVHRVTEIIGFKVPLNKRDNTSAQITMFGNGSCKITINLFNHAIVSLGNQKFKKIFFRHENIETVLMALAHELAHLKVWEHTPAHLELTAKILRVFAKTAAKQNVLDTSHRLRIR